MPTDPALFSFWVALILPIDDREKAKLLPIKSARLRLMLVVRWIEKLNGEWYAVLLRVRSVDHNYWFSGGFRMDVQFYEVLAFCRSLQVSLSLSLIGFGY